jgi:RNA polymerase sigma factor (sigma-70 family)
VAKPGQARLSDGRSAMGCCTEGTRPHLIRARPCRQNGTLPHNSKAWWQKTSPQKRDPDPPFRPVKPPALSASLINETSDTDLVLACRSRDEAAWGMLVRRYQRLVYTVPRRAGLNEAESADVFQGTFSKLVENLHRLDDPSRVRAWLVTTARRESLRQLEHRTRLAGAGRHQGGHQDEHGLAEDLLASLPDPSPLPEQQLEDLQQQDLLHRALAKMDDRSRLFLELMYLKDPPLGYVELAERMGMAEGSIGPTRARCLDKLRRLMATM